MPQEIVEEESGEMHSEDDKALSDQNKKRTVKTQAQIQALEKCYNEPNYPTESMKIELAESIGLTEKQVSGWFCHRKLKDKRLMNGENNATLKKHRSSGVVQDRGSGLIEDSCGSTKHIDTREVKSGRLTPKEFSGNYNRAPEGSSGSSSSLRDMSNHDHVRVTSSRYPVPRFPADEGIKPRTGPSGYLKVKKGRFENTAITAVKHQLGKNYRPDGPPLSVEFDTIPPGAFEPSMQDPNDEAYDTEEILPNSHDVSRLRQIPKFGDGYGYNSNVPSYNTTDTCVRTKREYHTPYHNFQPEYKQNASFLNDNGFYTNRNSLMGLREESNEDIPSSRRGEDNEQRSNQGVEVPRMRSSSHSYNVEGTKNSYGEYMENEYGYLAMKGNEFHNSEDKGPFTQIMKDEKFCAERRTINERRVKMKNDFIAPKRKNEEFSLQKQMKRSQKMDSRHRINS